MTLPASQDPLAQLADIHLPPPPPSFPWAWGWFALAAIALFALLWLTYIGLRRYRNNAYRRSALNELKHLSSLDNDQHYAAASQQLLRRVAVHVLGSDAAALRGKSLCEKLNQSYPAFDEAHIAALEDANYRRDYHFAARPEFHQQLLLWLRKHRRPRQC